MSNNDMISFPRELSDGLAELIAEKARVCGAGAFDIWEEICERFGTQAKHQGEPVAWINSATGHVTTSPVVVMDWDDEKEPVQSLYTSQPAPVSAVLPDNLESHRNTWIQAMERLVELEPESCAPDEDEKGLWRHELKAMRDMYADLDRFSTK